MALNEVGGITIKCLEKLEDKNRNFSVRKKFLNRLEVLG